MATKPAQSVVIAYNSMHEVLSLLQDMLIANDANTLSKRMVDAIGIRAVDMLAKARHALYDEHPDLDVSVKRLSGKHEGCAE